MDDPGVIRLVRAYLNAGIMDGGVVVERMEETPQGGPLSPLLANVLLDEASLGAKPKVAQLVAANSRRWRHNNALARIAG